MDPPPPQVKIGNFKKIGIGIGMFFLLEEKIGIGIGMLFTSQNRYRYWYSYRG